MDIQGFSDYLIYPDGKVFSKKSKKYLKSGDNGLGYKFVILYPDRKSYTIHRLVAIHYIDKPDDLNEVDHINRIKDDNRVENLRWVSRSENNTNKDIQMRNNTGFKWITLSKTRDTYIYCFQRKNCKRKSSMNLSKMLCYSFFYILKLSNQ
jgi:hypothetical protein